MIHNPEDYVKEFTAAVEELLVAPRTAEEVSRYLHVHLRENYYFSGVPETYTLWGSLCDAISAGDPDRIRGWVWEFSVHSWLCKNYEQIDNFNRQALKDHPVGGSEAGLSFGIAGTESSFVIVFNYESRFADPARYLHAVGTLRKFGHSSVFGHMRGIGSVHGTLEVTCPSDWWTTVESLLGDIGTKKKIEFRDSVVLGECPICLSDITADLHVARCGHRFHESCLNPWLEQNGTCPSCRADLGQSAAYLRQFTEAFITAVAVAKRTRDSRANEWLTVLGSDHGWELARIRQQISSYPAKEEMYKIMCKSSRPDRLMGHFTALAKHADACRQNP